MPSSTITTDARARLLAALRREPVDRLPVWLKMANGTWRHGQDPAVRALDDMSLLRVAGCDLILACGLVAHAEAPHVATRRHEEERRITITQRTPDGELVHRIGKDPGSGTRHPESYPVNDRDDLRRARWLYTDTRYHVDPAGQAAARARQDAIAAAGGISFTGIGPGPLMHCVENLCGPENLVYLLHDAPEDMAQLLQLMHEDRLRHLAALLPATAADTFWMTENTSTTLISPAMFRTHCVPHLRAYGAAIAAHDLIGVHHMCGCLDALLEDIDGLPAPVNEAFTTAPVGDTSLAAGRRRMPSKALVGGTNATLWLRPVDAIVAAVQADLDACPDHRGIVLTSAGVLPPPVSLDKARAVVQELRALPARM